MGGPPFDLEGDDLSDDFEDYGEYEARLAIDSGAWSSRPDSSWLARPRGLPGVWVGRIVAAAQHTPRARRPTSLGADQALSATLDTRSGI